MSDPELRVSFEFSFLSWSLYPNTAKRTWTIRLIPLFSYFSNFFCHFLFHPSSLDIDRRALQSPPYKIQLFTPSLELENCRKSLRTQCSGMRGKENATDCRSRTYNLILIFSERRHNSTRSVRRGERESHERSVLDGVGPTEVGSRVATKL